MKKTDFLILAVGLLAFAALVIQAKLDSTKADYTDRVTIQEIRDNKQDERIKALEKEIRILKTDMYVLQYGYEGGEE